MRPLDLIAFKIDDDHKAFLRQQHSSEKNYKTSKYFEAYSWGRAENFQLGYPTIKDSQKQPKLISFLDHNDVPVDVSIKEVVCCESFTLALSDSGDLYSWGCGNFGHCGNGSESTELHPLKIKFDFTEETKKIHKSKKKFCEENKKDIEEMRFFQQFVKSSSKNLNYMQVIDTKVAVYNNQPNERAEIHLQLMNMDRVCVTKIACSNTHSVVVSSDCFSLVHEHWKCIQLGPE